MTNEALTRPQGAVSYTSIFGEGGGGEIRRDMRRVRPRIKGYVGLRETIAGCMGRALRPRKNAQDGTVSSSTAS